MIVAQLLCGFVILGTLMAFSSRRIWWVRGWDYPRAQLAALGAFGILLYLIWWPHLGISDGVWIVATLAAVLYQTYLIWPYTALGTIQVAPVSPDCPTRVSFFVSNVYMENRNADAIQQIIEDFDPDVIFMVETDAWWDEQMAYLEERYPYAVRHPLDNTYGLLFYSRLHTEELETQYLVEDDKPSVKALLRTEAGHRIRLWGLHPDPPNPKYAERTTERDAELLIVGRTAKEEGHPVVVMGDFNDVAWSHTTRVFQRLSGLLDPRRGRGTYSTFNAKWPLMRWPLDHLFHSDHFTLDRLERGPAWGSDHFPIYVELGLEPLKTSPDPPEEADAEDYQEMEDVIQEAEPTGDGEA
ncbi:MAG: endonuclease/exonuclease/phosphatase family protein [Rhodothermales bacterium]